MNAARSFAEIEAEIIAKARRGDDGAGEAWLALHDAARDADGDGDLASRYRQRVRQHKNDEYRSRRAVQTPVAMAPRDAMTQRRDADDTAPDLSPVFVDDDKRVWTRAMIIAAGLSGTRFRSPDAFGDDAEDDEFNARVEAARLKIKPRDRVVLACVYDEQLSVAQTARLVKKTNAAIYASLKRIAQAIGSAV